MPATSLTHETDVAPPRWRLAGRVRPSWRRLAEVAGATAAALLLLLAPLMLGREALRHHQAERQAQMVQALGLALEAASGDLPARLHTLQVLPAASGGWAGEIDIVDGSRRPLAHNDGATVLRRGLARGGGTLGPS